MNAIRELKNEHEAVLLTLDMLESIIKKIDQAGQVLYPTELQQLTDSSGYLWTNAIMARKSGICSRPWRPLEWATTAAPSV